MLIPSAELTAVQTLDNDVLPSIIQVIGGLHKSFIHRRNHLRLKLLTVLKYSLLERLENLIC
jgi:hypothetical protein